MILPDSATLKQKAYARLREARDPGKIALVYAAVTIGIAALVTVIQFLLDEQLSQAGGLHNIGSRSMLSSIQVLLPVIQTGVLLCLDLGFTSAMLRIARGQYASVNGLRLGFDRFWQLVRATLLQLAVYLGVCFCSFYAAFLLFVISPFSKEAMSIMTPLVTDTSMLDSGVLAIDAATEQALIHSLAPFMILYLIVVLVLGAPIFYRYRMVHYLVIDNPGMGAFRLLRESKTMMRGNALKLLKLDLSFWWYYLLTALASVISYGDLILSALGVSLPLPYGVNYFLFFFLYLAALFGIYYFLRSGVETTYAAAYDAILPKDNNNGGVVLGNIFQM